MFQPSQQQFSFRQQTIALTQSYPCPRCLKGVIEPFGLTETLYCTDCQRKFVALKGGRFLYPASLLGWKIAPTFWWDGFRWHWAGTTATTRQLLVMVIVSLLPVVAADLFLYLRCRWVAYPDWCHPTLVSLLAGLLAIQLVYLLCWDFQFLHKRPVPRRRKGRQAH